MLAMFILTLCTDDVHNKTTKKEMSCPHEGRIQDLGHSGALPEVGVKVVLRQINQINLTCCSF